MKKLVFELEVGVHLNKDNKEYECYAITGATPTTELGYYDENLIAFFDYNKAKRYANDYVKNGVINTYAFITSDIFNLDDTDIKSIKNNLYFEHSREIPNIQELLYYIYKNENGKIITLINKTINNKGEKK